MFPICSNEQPLAEKIVQTLMEMDQYDMKIQKEELSTNTKLQGLNKGVNDFREAVKHFEHTNEFLVRVQSQS